MAKILKNVTVSSILVDDVGITIPASSSHTIQPQNDALWAASSDLVGFVGDGDIVVNDGTNDLSKSDGLKLVQGIFPNPVGVADGSLNPIGSVSGALKSFVDNPSSSPVPVAFPSTNLDAFGRVRVSNPESLFESTFLYDKRPLLFSESTVGSATITHDSNKSSVKFSTTTASGDKAIFQSRRRFLYHPGKSMLTILTGNLGGEVIGNRKRIGTFDENNGVFFELEGDTAYVVIRSKVSGSVVDTKISQQNWNLDKLDGTGNSGINIDWSKQQLLFMDYQWLGSVRFGTIVGGRIIYTHEQFHANELSVPWAQRANWPVRAETENTATTSVGTEAFLSCATIISEGGFGPDGVVRSVSSGVTGKNVDSSVNFIPVLSLRKKSAFNDTDIQLLQSSLFLESTDSVEYAIIINGSLTGASWVSSDGIGEYDVSATSISNGVIINVNYLNGAGSAPSVAVESSVFESFNATLGTDLDGNSDIITIAARHVTNNATALAAINYRELI